MQAVDLRWLSEATNALLGFSPAQLLRGIQIYNAVEKAHKLSPSLSLLCCPIVFPLLLMCAQGLKTQRRLGLPKIEVIIP